MNIPREFIELLLTKIDLVDVVNTQVPLRKKSGNNYFARCPFHNEKTASFSVSQPKQFYYCFGCGTHGNAIDFIMQYDRLSFPEAVETLAKQIGMEVPHAIISSRTAGSMTELFEVMTKAANYYYDQMRKSPRAINYLKGRGISGNIAQLFHLGYAPLHFTHLIDHLAKTEKDKKKCLEVGLIIKKNEHNYYDRFRDRIMFPIHDYRGRLIGFGGRILDQGEPKYLNSPETPLFQKGHELYGLYQTLKANRKLNAVLVVEGYMDVIALFQHDITYAVATLGTATTTHHLQRLFRYTTEIIFCFDGDEAGKNAAWRALQVIFPVMQDNFQIRFLFLPEGEDPDSLIRKEGKIEFEKRIATAMPLSAFFFQTVGQQSNIETLEGRARLASIALNHIKQLPEGLFSQVLLEELGKRTRINIDELKKQGKSSTISQVIQHQQEPMQNNISIPLQLAMSLLVQYPDLVTLIKDSFPKNDLPGHHFFIQLVELIKAKPNITTGTLLEYWRGKKEEIFLSKLAQRKLTIPEKGREDEFLGTMRQVMLQGFDIEINKLLAKAATQALSNEEKLTLSMWINKKKALMQNQVITVS